MGICFVGVRTGSHSDNVCVRRRLVNWLLLGANYSVIGHNLFPLLELLILGSGLCRPHKPPLRIQKFLENFSKKLSNWSVL